MKNRERKKTHVYDETFELLKCFQFQSIFNISKHVSLQTAFRAQLTNSIDVHDDVIIERNCCQKYA